MNYLYLCLTPDLAPTAKNTDTEAHPELAKTNTGSVDSDSEMKRTSVKLPIQKKPGKEEVGTLTLSVHAKKKTTLLRAVGLIV